MFPLIYYQVPGRQIDSTSFNISSDLQLSNDKLHQCHCRGYLTAKMKLQKHKSHADKKTAPFVPPIHSYSIKLPKPILSAIPTKTSDISNAMSFEQELWQQRHKLHAGYPRLSNEDCRPWTVPICFAQEIRWVIMSMTLIMMMVVMMIYILWWSDCLSRKIITSFFLKICFLKNCFEFFFSKFSFFEFFFLKIVF